MVAMVIITLTCSVISELAASSRQLWSFARDGGLPLSSAISKVRMPRPFDPTRELILVIGTEGLEYPNQRRLPVLDDHNLAVTHQHRLNGCVERDGVRHSHSVYGIVYHHNWLRADETHSRRTSSATPLVSWSLWHGHKRCVTRLLDAAVSVCVLPACYARDTK